MVAKRSGADGASHISPQKKRKQEMDSSAKLFATIVDGIKAGDLPHEVSQVVVDTAQIAFAVHKEDRHKFQAEVVEMVGKLLKTRDDVLVKNVEGLQATTSDAEQAYSAFETKVQDAQSLVETRQKDVTPAKHTLADCTKVYKQTKDELASARDAQEEGELELKDAGSKKLLLEETFRDLGKPLIQGDVAEAEILPGVEKVMKIMKKFNFDAAMMTAVQTALSKIPSSRGPFDVCVVTQFDEAVKERVRSLEATLSAGETTKQKLAKDLSVADQKFQDALAKLKASASVFEKAQAAKDSADLSVTETKKQKVVQYAQLRKHKSGLNTAQAEVELFRDGPLAAFAQLCEFRAPTKEVSAEPANDAVMQSAAQEAGA